MSLLFLWFQWQTQQSHKYRYVSWMWSFCLVGKIHWNVQLVTRENSTLWCGGLLNASADISTHPSIVLLLYFGTNAIKGQNRYLHLRNGLTKKYTEIYFYRKCPQKGGLVIFSTWLYPRHSWFNVCTYGICQGQKDVHFKDALYSILTF